MDKNIFNDIDKQGLRMTHIVCKWTHCNSGLILVQDILIPTFKTNLAFLHSCR